MPALAVDARQGAGEEVETDGEVHDAPKLQRVAQCTFSSLPPHTSSIDLAPSGSVLLVTESALHIVVCVGRRCTKRSSDALPKNLAHDIAPFLPHDKALRSYQDTSHYLPLFHASIPSTRVQSGAGWLGGNTHPDGSPDWVALEEPRWTQARWAPVEIGAMCR